MGKIISMISNDLNSIEFKNFSIYVVLILPFVIGYSLYILIDRHGPLGVIFIILLLLVLPIQNYFGKKSMQHMVLANKHMDDRIKLTQEITEGIRLIKMYAWQQAFVKFTDLHRNKEMRELFKRLLNFEVIRMIGSVVIYPILLFPFIIIHYTSPENIDVAKIFGTMSLISIVRIWICMILGMGIGFIFEM
jgi:ATP-binding cassette subfamily C (CFTR/MRP) protein 4